MIKKQLSKLGKGKNFFNLIKFMYKKPIANIFNDERMHSFSVREE